MTLQRPGLRTSVAAFCLAAGLATGFAAAARAQMAPPKPAAPAGLNQLTAAEQKTGWTLLFDGKTLEGWRAYKKTDATGTRWAVKEGLLCLPPNDGSDTHGSRDIVSKGQYDQFELAWDWRITPGGNSGLKYFVLEDQDAAIGHEYQLIDDDKHPDAKIGPHRQTGALYDVLPAANRPIKPAGEWNTSRVLVHGKTVEHFLNGTKILTYELESPTLKAAIAKSKFKDVARFGTPQRAHLLLQDHGDSVCFRNMKIRATGTASSKSSQ